MTTCLQRTLPSLGLALFGLLSPLGHSLRAEPIPANITVDTETVELVSAMEIGISHIGQSWIWGNRTARERVDQHLVDGGITLQNLHIMGWGAGNPNPSPGTYNWNSLDQRMERMRDMGAEIIITLCTAPGWMKTSGEDWNMGDKVAVEHYDDFADLCVLIAERYPDVTYFQIWNELKGWWMGDIEGFTEFYNVVYLKLRAARPDAIIAGPYMNGLGTDLRNGGVLTTKSNNAFDYFLENMVGADTINFDGWLAGYPPENHGWTLQQLMDNTPTFGNLAAALRQKTDLPIWVSEYYAAVEKNHDDLAFTTANHASAYYHSLINDTAVLLHWDLFGFVPLFSSLATSFGGQPTLHYDVVVTYNQHFGPGTPILASTSNDTNIEVLASPEKTLLINKTADPYAVQFGDRSIPLDAYGIKVVDTIPTTVLPLTDVATEQTTGNMLIIWPSDIGRTYTIERSSSLEGPWSVEQAGIAGRPPQNSVSLPLSGDRAFYRVVLQP